MKEDSGAVWRKLWGANAENNLTEIRMAATLPRPLNRPAYPLEDSTRRAVSNLGVSTGTQQTISGNVTSISSYVVSGNTRWVLGIRTNSTTTVQVLAKAETLTAADQVTIATITIGAKIKVLVDTSQTPPT